MRTLFSACGFLVLIGCSGNGNTVSTNTIDNMGKIIENQLSNSTIKFYKDFDIFNIQGINEITSGTYQYPYLKIEANKDSIVYTAYFSDDKSFKSPVFFKENGIYKSFRKYSGDFCNIYEYGIFTKSKILTYSYCGDPYVDKESYLYSVTTETPTKFEELYYGDYFLGNPSKYSTLILPTTNFIQPNQKYLVAKTTREYLKDGDLLKVIGTEINFNDNSESKNISCYSLKNHSMFWWSLYGNFMKIDCK